MICRETKAGLMNEIAKLRVRNKALEKKLETLLWVLDNTDWENNVTDHGKARAIVREAQALQDS